MGMPYQNTNIGAGLFGSFEQGRLQGQAMAAQGGLQGLGRGLGQLQIQPGSWTPVKALTPIFERVLTFKEELQAEIDEWLEDVKF